MDHLANGIAGDIRYKMRAVTDGRDMAQLSLDSLGHNEAGWEALTGTTSLPSIEVESEPQSDGWKKNGWMMKHSQNARANSLLRFTNADIVALELANSRIWSATKP